MKKLIVLLGIILFASCTADDTELRLAQECNCRDQIQFTYVENTNTQLGDYYEEVNSSKDCSLDGEVTVTETPFGDGVIVKTVTVNCNPE